MATNIHIDINTENIIEKNEPHKTIESLFADYDENYTPEEYDWGKPVGKEIW